jgi:hypothetical protein
MGMREEPSALEEEAKHHRKPDVLQLIQAVSQEFTKLSAVEPGHMGQYWCSLRISPFVLQSIGDGRLSWQARHLFTSYEIAKVIS